MKLLFSHPLRILIMLILASTLLAASSNAQSAIPSPGVNITAVDETAPQSTMGNPAAVYCTDLGYEYQIVGEDGQRGVCVLPGGQVCDAWAFLQGKCGQSYSYCAQQGYQTRTVMDGKDAFSSEYAVCVTKEGAVVGSVTELSDLSQKATDCGGEISGEGMPPMLEEGDRYVPSLDAAPPTSFDWRSYLGSNWLSPIKNQGQCGSCWAFAAVGAAEAAHNIASNDPTLDLDLSEQYLVADCTSGACCGGSKYSALAFIQASGVPDEACMTYVDGTGCTCPGGTCDTGCSYRTGGRCSDRTCADRCGDWDSRLTHITSTGYVGTDLQTIKQALVDTGPLAVSMGWGSDFGGGWDGDIYRCSSDSGTNHAVVLVGYDDAGGYWLVRNSWGTSWGEGGYFKLGYGECYVEQYVYYADAGPSVVGPLEYYSHMNDDDNSGNSIGNGDGIVDCGETIELYVALINQGSSLINQSIDGATGVGASISTSDPYVTWLFNTYSPYPDIAGGAVGINTDDYDFEVDPDTPNGHLIHFDLDISASNGGSWTDSFEVPVTCDLPAPTVTSITPDLGENSGVVSITDLAGSDFRPGATVKLVKTGQADIDAGNVVVVGTTQITCDFDLSGATTGAWDVVVTNPDAQSSTLPGGFAVYSTMSLDLSLGWNLISLSLEPLDPAPQEVLSSIAGDYDQVLAYDGCDSGDPWTQYIPGGGGNDLTAMGVERGYWVHTTAPAALTVAGTLPATVNIPLCTGWNLAGYPSQTALPVTGALSSIDGQYTRVMTWDSTEPGNPWVQYDTGVPVYANDLATMDPGWGYWLRVTENCTWTVTP